MPLNRLLGSVGLRNFISPGTALNISTLVSGTAMSTALPILVAPLLSRIFNPEQFGIAGLYISISMLIGVVAYSHYAHTILLSADDNEAKQSIWFTLFLTVSISILFLAVITALHVFTDSLKGSAVGLWFFLVPLTVVLNGIVSTVSMWSNRVQRYGVLARSRVIQAMTTVAVQLSIGLSIRGEAGLIVGFLAGQVAGCAILCREFVFKKEYGIGSPAVSTFRAIAVKHRSLALYSTPSEFINSLINQAPYLLLQKFAGINAVGSYAFTQRLMGLPQLLISGAVTEVFKQKASASYNAEGNCQRIFLKTFATLGLAGLIPFIALLLFAPALVVLVFGQEWQQAGVFIQLMGVLYYFRFVVSPLSYVYYIAGKVAEDLYLHIVFLASIVLAFYIGYTFFGDANMIILCYSLTYSAMYLVYLARSYKFSCA